MGWGSLRVLGTAPEAGDSLPNYAAHQYQQNSCNKMGTVPYHFLTNQSSPVGWWETTAWPLLQHSIKPSSGHPASTTSLPASSFPAYTPTTMDTQALPVDLVWGSPPTNYRSVSEIKKSSMKKKVPTRISGSVKVFMAGAFAESFYPFYCNIGMLQLSLLQFPLLWPWPLPLLNIICKQAVTQHPNSAC